jgi:hypothetical protein
MIERKYTPLLEDINKQGWNTTPFIVIIARAKEAIYQMTKTQLNQSPLKLKTATPKKTLKAIYHSAIQFLMHIILTKGLLYLRGWAQAQKHKWYPAWRMKAIGSGVPSQKQGS